MRFLHTSDWHLGRIFHGLHLIPDQTAVLEQVISIALDSKVDAVLIAGDIYDRAVPPTEAVNLLDNTLQQLVLKHRLPVILIAGNHDNPQRLNFGQALFAANKLFIYGPVSTSATPVVLEDKEGPVYFVPLTYCEPLTATELSGTKCPTHKAALSWQISQMLSQIPPQARKVALAHCFVTGALATPDSERSLTVGGSEQVDLQTFAPFNYTALGHLHACQSCNSQVRYSGSLLKYSFGEAAQKKAVHIIDLDAAGNIQAETIPLTAPHELAVLKGTFAQLTSTPEKALVNDYLQVILTDVTPVLDAKNKLESLYPHILQLSYEQLALGANNLPATILGTNKLSRETLFADFFQQTLNRSLTSEETKILHTALDDLAKEGRQL